MTVPEPDEPVATEPASGPDLLDLLHREHLAVQQMCAELVSAVGSARHRRQLADVVVAELSRHTFLEERFLYPAVREYPAVGPCPADPRAIEEAVRRLWKLDVATAEFGRAGDELTTAVRAHVRTAEEELFPRLRAACPQARLAELGQRVREARELAPTRPHLHAPATSRWSRLTTPLLGLADQVRDELTGRCTRLDRLTG